MSEKICQMCNNYKKKVYYCDNCKNCLCDACSIGFYTCSCNQCKCM